MSSPDKIFIDERVAQTLPTEPDQSLRNRGVKIETYIREDIVRQKIDDARMESMAILGEERVVQIDDNIALTSHGRLFMRTNITESGHETLIFRWELIPGPSFDLKQIGVDHGNG